MKDIDEWMSVRTCLPVLTTTELGPNANDDTTQLLFI